LTNDFEKDDLIAGLVDEDFDRNNRHHVKIIRSLIVDLLDDAIQNVNLFDFYQIRGKIMNIDEDNCCFDFYCSNCFKKENKKANNPKFNLNNHGLETNKQKLMFDLEKK
jgi:hypothetical protein